MDINELFKLSQWVEKEIAAPKIPKSYRALVEKIRNMAQANQAKQPFDPEKENLIAKLRAVPLHQLTNEQRLYLEKFDFLPYVGEAGVQYIDVVLKDNTHDLVTIGDKLNKAADQINSGVGRFSTVQQALTDFADREIVPDAGKALIRVTFTKEAAIHNIGNLEKWSEKWSLIIRGFTMAHGQTPEDVKIVGVSNGSVIIDFMAVLQVAGSLTGVLVGLVTLAEKILTLKKNAKDMRTSDVAKKEEIATLLDQSAEAEKEAGVKKIINNINIQNLTINTTINNNTPATPTTPQTVTDGDKVIALERAVTTLLDFVVKGGEVDVIPPEKPSSEDNVSEALQKEFAQLKSGAEELRKIESKQKLLEFRKDDVPRE